jgi:hypothetical protein
MTPVVAGYVGILFWFVVSAADVLVRAWMGRSA